MEGSRFEKILLHFLEKIESIVKSLIFLGFITLLCIQFALTQMPARQYLSYVDKLEGQRIQGEQANYAEGPLEIREKTVTAKPDTNKSGEIRSLIIYLIDPLPQDGATVLVNRQNVLPFTQGEVNLNIQEGDLLEIDGSSAEKSLKFRIFAPNNDIEIPASDSIVETKGNKVILGEVRFKH